MIATGVGVLIAGFGGALMATAVAIVASGCGVGDSGEVWVDTARHGCRGLGQRAGDPLLHPLHRVHSSAARVYK